MAQFYHDLITEKSFEFLQKLQKSHRFVLIGGWAVFLYTRSLKSKDIDIIVEYEELGRLRDDFTVNKNERLKKYEIKTGEFDVDIYVPHYSSLGIPAEVVQEAAVSQGGFQVPPPELLLILKLCAWHQRRGSVKGRKDEVDILSLVFLPEFNFEEYARQVSRFQLEEYHEEILALLKSTRRVPELNLNDQQIARLKKKVKF